MRSRSESARRKGRLDAHGRDSITALVGVALVVAAAIGACNLDPPNPPLQNEAPNRGEFVGGIAIGAGPGTGGSGAGLSTGTTTPTGSGGGGPAPANCACGVSYSLGDNCLGCFNSEESTGCATQESTCMGDTASPNCTTLFQELLACGGSVACVKMILDEGANNATFVGLLQCGCGQCTSMCAGSSC